MKRLICLAFCLIVNWAADLAAQSENNYELIITVTNNDDHGNLVIFIDRTKILDEVLYSCWKPSGDDFVVASDDILLGGESEPSTDITFDWGVAHMGGCPCVNLDTIGWAISVISVRQDTGNSDFKTLDSVLVDWADQNYSEDLPPGTFNDLYIDYDVSTGKFCQTHIADTLELAGNGALHTFWDLIVIPKDPTYEPEFY